MEYTEKYIYIDYSNIVAGAVLIDLGYDERQNNEVLFEVIYANVTTEALSNTNLIIKCDRVATNYKSNVLRDTQICCLYNNGTVNESTENIFINSCSQNPRLLFYNLKNFNVYLVDSESGIIPFSTVTEFILNIKLTYPKKNEIANSFIKQLPMSSL